MCKFSIVIPCYCSGDWLPELVERIDKTMRVYGESFEVILVNDASPDNTWHHIAELAQQYSFVHGVDLLFNTGQQRTTICGLERARGEYVILMDDDLQHLPEEIPRLIRAMQSETAPDCVMGIYDQKQHSLFRNLGSRAWRYIVAKLYDVPTTLKMSSFRIMNRELAQALCLHGTVSPMLGVLIYRTTSRVANTLVDHRPRVGAKVDTDLLVS